MLLGNNQFSKEKIKKILTSRHFVFVLLIILISAPLFSKSFRMHITRKIFEIRYNFFGGVTADSSDAGVYFQYLPVPTVSNFSASSYTGSATVNYPIKLPPGPGGLSPSLGFSYSSSSVDDLLNFLPTNTKRWFVRQSGAMGLGWGLSGGNYSISIDTHGQEDPNNSCKWTWHIGFPGGSAELIKVDGTGNKISRCGWEEVDGMYAWRKNNAWENGQWTTDPEIFIKVVSSPSNGRKYITEGGRWVIRTSDNTQYIFGENSDSIYKYDNGATRVSSFPHIWGLPHDGCYANNGILWHVTIIPTNWKLYKAINVFGQEVVYDYKPYEKNVGVGSEVDYCNASGTYIVRSEINNLSYGQNQVKFYYNKTREDWRLVNKDNGEYVVEDTGSYDANDKNVLFILDSALSKVEVLKGGNIQRTYNLGYYDSYQTINQEQNGAWTYGHYVVNDSNPISSFHLMLRSIQEVGHDGTTSLPANIFTYQKTSFYLEDPNSPEGKGSLFTTGRNNIYISEANNGYDGKMKYDFQNPQLIANICDEKGNCKIDNSESLQRSRLTRVRTINKDEFWDTIYKYIENEKPLVYFVENGNQYYTPPTIPDGFVSCGCCDTSDWDPIDGSCYDRGDPPGTQCCCGTGDCTKYVDGSCLSHDYCKAEAPVPIHPEKNYNFLGYSLVELQTYPKNVEIIPFQTPPVSPLSSSKQFFHQRLISDGCFQPDPRAGLSYKSWALTLQAGKVISETLNNFNFSSNNSCTSAVNQARLPLLIQTDSYSTNLNLAATLSNNQTLKDYCATHSCAHTRVLNSYDWVFSSTTKQNKDAGKYAGLINTVNEGDMARGDDQSKFVTSYTSQTGGSNWIINKPKETWIEEYPSPGKKYSWIKYYYDNQSTYGVIPTTGKGIVTSVEAVEDTTGETLRTYMEHDNYGNLVENVDARGYSTYTQYDAIGTYPIVVRNHLGHEVETTYHPTLGLPVSVSNANGNTTSFEYDAIGRLKKEIRPGDSSQSPTSEFTYYINDQGKNSALAVYTKTKISQGNYLESYDFYNALGAKFETQSLLPGGTVLTSYSETDSLGRVPKAHIPFEGDTFGQAMGMAPSGTPYTLSEYDDIGRTFKATNPDGRVIQNFYDIVGFRSAMKDPEGKVVQSYSDGLGRNIKSAECGVSAGFCDSGREVSFDYDILGNLKRVTDTLGLTTTTNIYDTLGRKIQTDDSDLGSWSYLYDKNGNLEEQTSPLGHVTRLTYDELGRLLTKTFTADSQTRTIASYQYDQGTNGISHKTQYTDEYQQITYQYDARGRLTQSTKTITSDDIINKTDLATTTFTTQYQHDNIDRQTAMTIPATDLFAAEMVNFGYLGPYLKTVTGNQSYMTDAEYDLYGKLVSRTLGNGVIETFDYNPLNQRLTDLAVYAPGTNPSGDGDILDYSYFYYPSGNISSISELVGGLSRTESFNYDDYYRLISAASSNYTSSYVYDEIDRMTKKTINGQVTDFTY